MTKYIEIFFEKGSDCLVYTLTVKTTNYSFLLCQKSSCKNINNLGYYIESISWCFGFVAKQLHRFADNHDGAR